MDRFERMKESAKKLISMANSSATQLNEEMIKDEELKKRFPAITNVDLGQWDFFVSVACVWAAIAQLNNEDIPANKKEEVRKTVVRSLMERYSDGPMALEDCTGLIKKEGSRDAIVDPISGNEVTGTEQALGLWIVCNLLQRMELNNEEWRIALVLGHLCFKFYESFWK